MNVLEVCAYHLYADDTQIYYSFDPSQTVLASAQINEDMFRLVSSAKSHCLSINPEKTSVLLFGSQKLRDRALPLLKMELQGDGVFR